MSKEGRLSPGSDLPAWETSATASRQKRYLQATEVDPNRYGELADVSILATDCFLSLRKARIRIDRQVHMEQSIHQHGPVKLDKKPEGARIRCVAPTGVLACEATIQASE